MDRKDWNLLVIAAADGKPLQPVQLQKCLFLLGQDYPGDVGPEYYKFEPYDYGPFSASVYQDAEELAAEGLVTISTNRRWKEFAATPDGMSKAAMLEQKIHLIVSEAIEEYVRWATSLDFRRLVSEVYKKYPAYRVNSIFKD